MRSRVTLESLLDCLVFWDHYRSGGPCQRGAALGRIGVSRMADCSHRVWPGSQQSDDGTSLRPSTCRY